MTVIQLIGGRWKPRILWALRPGPQRFGVLQRATGASSRMLSKSLQELEADGLVGRRVMEVGAVSTSEYSFSAYGGTLIPVLDRMGDWGRMHQSRSPG